MEMSIGDGDSSDGFDADALETLRTDIRLLEKRHRGLARGMQQDMNSLRKDVDELKALRRDFDSVRVELSYLKDNLFSTMSPDALEARVSKEVAKAISKLFHGVEGLPCQLREALPVADSCLEGLLPAADGSCEGLPVADSGLEGLPNQMPQIVPVAHSCLEQENVSRTPRGTVRFAEDLVFTRTLTPDCAKVDTPRTEWFAMDESDTEDIGKVYHETSREYHLLRAVVSILWCQDDRDIMQSFFSAWRHHVDSIPKSDRYHCENQMGRTSSGGNTWYTASINIEHGAISEEQLLRRATMLMWDYKPELMLTSYFNFWKDYITIEEDETF